MNKRCTIVVRSAGERTEELCINILKKQVPEENIAIVRASPFYKAVMESFRIGAVRANDWTLTVDADVLVRDNAIEEMITRAKQFTGELFVYQGYVLDRLFNDYREGGPHLYKSMHLSRAMEFVTTESQSLRPESDVYHEMVKNGLGFWVDDRVYGIHDFFQYRKDIVRKCFVHALKHSKQASAFLPAWLNDIEDQDNRAALVGLLSGFLETRKVSNDIKYFKTVADDLMKRHGLTEKQIANNLQADLASVERTLVSFEKRSMYQKEKRRRLRSKQFPRKRWNTMSVGERASEYCLKPVFRRVAKVLQKVAEELTQLT